MNGEAEPTPAELRGQIAALEHQGYADRDAISALQDQAAIDRALIEQLEIDEVVDKREIEGLQVALATCRKIGLAMGLLMAMRRVSEPEAFGILRSASQDTQRKLRDIADDVIRTGDLQGAASSQQ